MPYVITRERWQRQPEYLTGVDFTHPLAQGFENPRAFFYVFNAGNAGDYSTVLSFIAHDSTGNNSDQAVSHLDSAGNYPILKGVPAGGSYGNTGQRLLFGAASTGFIQTNVLIDAKINAQGTVYWAQDPNTAFNASTIRSPWGATTGAGNPSFSAQAFVDNNLYIGWANGGDARVIIANSAALWTTGRLQHWALTWINGGKSKLFVDGILVGTAANNLSVSAFSGTDTFAIGKQGGLPNYWDGSLAYFGITGAEHSVGQIEAFAENPYQFLMPRVRRKFLGPVSAAVAGLLAVGSGDGAGGGVGTTAVGSAG
jgi:hypothetical protein